MATVYKIEVVSHWINYPKEVLEKKIKEALKEEGNEIQVNVKERR